MPTYRSLPVTVDHLMTAIKQLSLLSCMSSCNSSPRGNSTRPAG